MHRHFCGSGPVAEDRVLGTGEHALDLCCALMHGHTKGGIVRIHFEVPICINLLHPTVHRDTPFVSTDIRTTSLAALDFHYPPTS